MTKKRIIAYALAITSLFGLNEENSIENLMKGKFNGTYVTV